MAARISAGMILLVLASCASPRPATQVTVLVDAEPHVRGIATELRVRVTGGHDGETFLESGDPIVRGAPLGWPFDVTVIPAANDATRLFEVEATAYDSGHQLVSQARLRGGFVRGDARHVTLLLEDACIGISCPEGRACRQGQCVPIGSGDADAGTSDAGGDAGPIVCTVDRDCDDDNACNGFERCVNGSCTPGARLDCDDHVGCTTDTCDGRRCVHTTDDTRCTADTGGRCDAVNDCQYATCNATNCASTGCQTASCSAAGVCERTFACAAGTTCCGTACVPTGCDDGLPCTTDYCAAAESACHHDPHAGPCDDGDLCTAPGTCDATGRCTAGARMTCDDANGCTTDGCDPATGCANVPNALPCDDENPCTVGDTCGSSTCQPGPPSSCDDGIACTVDSCDRSRGCQHAPTDSLCGTGSHCDAAHGCQVTGTCTMANCQPTPGTCETATCSADFTTCVRGTTCTGAQMCCGHACVPLQCSDGDACTDDACNASRSACDHTPVTGRTCDDHDACTSPDTCQNGTCRGAPRSCNDFEDCTADSCNAATGNCDHVILDGAPCFPLGSCVGEGFCSAGTCYGTGCPDGQVCCAGSCEVQTGGVVCAM